MPRLVSLKASDPTDAELADACVRGDKQAWGALVSRYSSLIYSVAVRYGLAGAAASTAFQQACAAIARELPAAARAEDLGRWIATVASRECWDIMRRVARPDPDSDTGAAAASEPLRDEVVKELEQQYRLRLALRQLGSRCQALILGLYYQQPPKQYAEVAREAGIEEQEVGGHRARCLWHLKQVLEDSR